MRTGPAHAGEAHCLNMWRQKSTFSSKASKVLIFDANQTKILHLLPRPELISPSFHSLEHSLASLKALDCFCSYLNLALTYYLKQGPPPTCCLLSVITQHFPPHSFLPLGTAVTITTTTSNTFNATTTTTASDTTTTATHTATTSTTTSV